jgi:hypothetical protein
LETGEILEADAFVVACGPWSDEARSWFPVDADNRKESNAFSPVYGQKYHSILIQSPRVLSQAVFFQGAGDPEVYVSIISGIARMLCVSASLPRHQGSKLTERNLAPILYMLNIMSSATS